MPSAHEKVDGHERRVNREPLPRIISSSFLTCHEIDDKNIRMLGNREQPHYLFMASESQEAVNRTYVKARKAALFKEGGGDSRWLGLYA